MMKNIKLVLSSAIIIPLVGCSILPHPDEITPNQMLKYQSPENIINSKNLNGKAGTGKDYMLTGYKEAFLPHAYMNNLCKSQNGSFRQIQRSTYAFLDKRNNSSPKTVGSELSPHIGIFECNVSSPWYVSIEPLSSHFSGTKKNLDIIKLKTQAIDRSSLKGNIDYNNVYRQEQLEQDKKKYNEQLRHQNERQRQEQAHIDAKNRFISANAPTTKDIGKTICNETVLSAFTGIYVFGQPNFKQTNGTVIASVEGFSNDQKNIKINIKGFLNTQNGISAGSDVLYNQIPLEAGRTVWDNKANWFKCNY